MHHASTPTTPLAATTLALLGLACGGPLPDGDEALIETSQTAQTAAIGPGLDPGGPADPGPGTIDPDGPPVPLILTDLTNHGSMTLAAAEVAGTVESKRKVWAPVPGLSTVVRSRAGDNLAITASMEVLGSNTYTYVRAVVDGVPAQPGSVSFKDPESFDGLRSFTFVLPAVSAGQHVVTIEAHTGNVVTDLRGRTLSVRSTSPTTGTTRMAVAAGPPLSAVTSFGRWATVPDLTTSITTSGTRHFIIQFSGDMYSENRVFVRAVLDGRVLQDALFASHGSHSGARTYTFVANNVAAGTHDVRIEWYGEVSPARLQARTLVVTASPTGSDGGAVAFATERAAVLYNSSAWTDVTAEQEFGTTLANTSLAVTVGGHVYGSGRLQARVLLDGVVVGSGPVTLGENLNAWRGTGYTFVATHIAPGRHRVRFQVSSSGTSYLADHFFTTEYRPRPATDVMKPFLGMMPEHQRPPALVICFDPMRPEHVRPSRAYLGEMIEGSGPLLSMPAWFHENGGNLTRFSSVRWSGCQDGAWHEADEGKRGNYYWDNNAYAEMWQDAMRKADPDVDFHAYDVDQDGRLTPDEVVVMIVRPQNTAYGTIRSTSLGLDGAGSLDVRLADLYLGAAADRRRLNVGLTAHELSHAMLGALDLHNCGSTTRPDTASIMDGHGEATLLDPLHRLKFGYAIPSMVDIPATPNTPGLVLPSAPLTRQVLILGDRSRGDREYFAIEYRRTNGDPTTSHDNLTPQVIVWHLLEDWSLATAFPPPNGQSCGPDRNSVRVRGRLMNAQQSFDLTWADGTSARMRVLLRSTPMVSADSVIVDLVRLP